MKPRTTRLINAYKIPLKADCSKADLKVKVRPRGLLTEEVKVSRKKLKRHTVSGEITSLEAESSELTVLIRDVLCKLGSKHTLYLLDRRVRLYIYIARDYLLNLSLATSCSSLCDSVANTCANKRDYIDDNLILVLAILVSINILRAVLISISIPGAF
jgi:predicted nucleic acid-binding Zn finger protein